MWWILNLNILEGKMYLNGIDKGDRVVIIDDTLSTGGAVIALAEALKTAGSTIEKVICAIEKVQNKGKEKVKRNYRIRCDLNYEN